MSEKFAFERTEEFNARVREWAERLRVAARSTVSSGVRQNTRLGRSIKTQLRKQDGQVFRISVGFAKEGVYIHVGAGRGYAGFKGGTFYSEARGRRVKVRETSIAKWVLDPVGHSHGLIHKLRLFFQSWLPLPRNTWLILGLKVK